MYITYDSVIPPSDIRTLKECMNMCPETHDRNVHISIARHCAKLEIRQINMNNRLEIKFCIFLLGHLSFFIDLQKVFFLKSIYISTYIYLYIYISISHTRVYTLTFSWLNMLQKYYSPSYPPRHIGQRLRNSVL